MKPETIQQFFKEFDSNDTCLEHIMKSRYGLSGECPHCKQQTHFSRVKKERSYACQWCGWHTYPCAGTPFEDSRTSLQLWFYAIYLFTSTRSGVSAKELQRQLGVTYKCAWRIGHQIRQHMAVVDGDDTLSGEVEIDETYIGGKTKGLGVQEGKRRKAIVMGMVERDGDLMTKVVPNVRKKTLLPIIEENIEKGSLLHTDELRTYKRLDKHGYGHDVVKHNMFQYVKGNAHVNTIEGFWSRLKQSIRGTHVHVSPKHLASYASEFEYRYNARKRPEKMFSELVSTFLPWQKQSS